MKTIQEVLNKIEELGWVITDEGYNYLLSQFSPAEQDFNIIVEKSDDVDEFIKNIYEAYENYDVSEEVRLWIDESGHGINGAPYEIADLVEDMKWCEQAIYDLWCELSGNIKEEEIDYKKLANRYLTIAYNAICLGQLDEIYADKEQLMNELGCTEEEYDAIMEE